MSRSLKRMSLILKSYSGQAVLQNPDRHVLAASNEPAKYVLSKMLAAVSRTPAGGSTPFAYHTLSDPLSHTYAFNVVNNSVLPLSASRPITTGPCSRPSFN